MTETECVTNLLLQQPAFSLSSKPLLTGELLSYLEVRPFYQSAVIYAFVRLLSTALDSATKRPHCKWKKRAKSVQVSQTTTKRLLFSLHALAAEDEAQTQEAFFSGCKLSQVGSGHEREGSVGGLHTPSH